MAISHQHHRGISLAAAIAGGAFINRSTSPSVRYSRLRSSLFGRLSGVTVQLTMAGDTIRSLAFPFIYRSLMNYTVLFRTVWTVAAKFILNWLSPGKKNASQDRLVRKRQGDRTWRG
jgi:hypothetical protein